METTQRISLTKKQCETEIGKELLALCLDLTEDGMLSTEEINQLRLLVNKNIDTDIAAIHHLNNAILLYFNSGSDERENKILLYKTIEHVLPVIDRKKASSNRKALEAEERAIRKIQIQDERLRAKDEIKRNRTILSANFIVAGCTLDNRQQQIERHARANDDVILYRDKLNKFSKNATKVLTKNGHHIGFIPEFYAGEVSDALDNGAKYDAFFTKLLDYDSPVRTIPVVQAYFFSSDSDHGRPAKQLKEDTVINLATPIMLIGLMVFVYFLFRIAIWLF
jgi:hypothetical protein